MQGSAKSPKKWHLPPGDQPCAANKSELFSLASGRLARLAQMNLTADSRRQALLSDLALWTKHAYKKRSVATTWLRAKALLQGDDVRTILDWLRLS